MTGTTLTLWRILLLLLAAGTVTVAILHMLGHLERPILAFLLACLLAGLATAVIGQVRIRRRITLPHDVVRQR